MAKRKPLISRADLENYVSFFGIDFGGDVGGWTCYRNKNGKPVIFPRTTPGKAPTANQLYQRNLFQVAQSNWKALTPTVKQKWEQLTNQLGLVMTGQNLYISLQLVDRSRFWPTIVRRTKTTLTYPRLLQP